ncbi:hypothetical protein NPIL_351 [Nephila pilipes]|uniref:Uncharacterized protein n=1 Tax=Nephila pilipes TaxID=299642 RepID=A0A8X6QQV7_NEPPI|nr:hypothetical protein NPIL_351 [Nephila pilipes]
MMKTQHRVTKPKVVKKVRRDYIKYGFSWWSDGSAPDHSASLRRSTKPEITVTQTGNTSAGRTVLMNSTCMEDCRLNACEGGYREMKVSVIYVVLCKDSIHDSQRYFRDTELKGCIRAENLRLRSLVYNDAKDKAQ